MCYGSFCGFEDSNGECRKPRRQPCPMESGECFCADDGRDVLCDQLYEQGRDDALMESQCSCS